MVVKLGVQETPFTKCDIIELYSFLGKKWTFALLSNINKDPVTFNQLHETSRHLINPTLLSDRLKEMIRFGIIERKVLEGRVSYLITHQGQELKSILHTIKEWAEKNGMEIPGKCKNCECVCTEVFKQ